MSTPGISKKPNITFRFKCLSSFKTKAKALSHLKDSINLPTTASDTPNTLKADFDGSQPESSSSPSHITKAKTRPFPNVAPSPQLAPACARSNTLAANAEDSARDFVLQVLSRGIVGSRKGNVPVEELRQDLIVLQSERNSNEKDRKARIHHTMLPLAKFVEFRRKCVGGSREELVSAFSQPGIDSYDGTAANRDPRFDVWGPAVKSTVFNRKPGQIQMSQKKPATNLVNAFRIAVAKSGTAKKSPALLPQKPKEPVATPPAVVPKVTAVPSPSAATAQEAAFVLAQTREIAYLQKENTQLEQEVAKLARKINAVSTPSARKDQSVLVLPPKMKRPAPHSVLGGKSAGTRSVGSMSPFKHDDDYFKRLRKLLTALEIEYQRLCSKLGRMLNPKYVLDLTSHAVALDDKIKKKTRGNRMLEIREYHTANGVVKLECPETFPSVVMEIRCLRTEYSAAVRDMCGLHIDLAKQAERAEKLYNREQMLKMEFATIASEAEDMGLDIGAAKAISPAELRRLELRQRKRELQGEISLLRTRGSIEEQELVRQVEELRERLRDAKEDKGGMRPKALTKR